MIRLNTKTEFKAYATRFLNVKFQIEGEEPFWIWDKSTTREIENSEMKGFMYDTFILLTDYRFSLSKDSKFDETVFSRYLEKWGCPFITSDNKISYIDVIFQAYLFSVIEGLLFHIKKNEIIKPIDELFQIWVNDLKRIDTEQENLIPNGFLVNTLLCKHWYYMPDTGSEGYWLPSSKAVSKASVNLLYFAKPNDEELQEMIENLEYRYNFFKKTVLKNMIKYINRYTKHAVTVNEYGNIGIRSVCSSLLAFYIFTRLGENEVYIPDPKTCPCGNVLSGRQKRFCSLKCKDKYYNGSESKKIDRWIYKMSYDKRISDKESERLRDIARDLFVEGESENAIRERISAELKS